MSETTKEKVVFFFPWNEISGGPFYLANLANNLANDDDYEVWYTDYEPGLSAQLIHNEKVKKLPYSEPFVFPIKEPVTLIVPIYCASHIPKLPANSKILFLNWHNYCIQSLVDIWKINPKDLQKFLKMVYDTDSVFFLDYAHWQAQNDWVENKEYTFKEQYVPITIKPKKTVSKGKLIDESINIAILGRLCTDKVWSILNLLEQLNEYDDPRPKNVYIIGDGPEGHHVVNYAVKNNINVIMKGTIVGEDLEKFISENADVLFAMGSSILEGAALKVPSVIMPHNVVPFSKDAYVYLQDTTGFSLGWYDTQIDDLDVQAHTLKKILDDVYVKNKKKDLAKTALSYVEEHHFNNVDALKTALAGTTLTYHYFHKHIAKRQGWIRRAGIPLARITTTMDESEKTASLFGFRNLFSIQITPQDKYICIFGKHREWIKVCKENDKFRLYVRMAFFKF